MADVCDNNKAQIEKLELYNQVLEKWVHLLQNGGTVRRFFDENNYKTIAIYGMGYLGGLLYDELLCQGIKIDYVIDQNPSRIYANKVYSLNDDFPTVDVIVITPVYYFDDISNMLKCKGVSRMVSLYDVVKDSEIYFRLDDSVKDEYLQINVR